MKNIFLYDSSRQTFDTNTRYSLMGIAMILVFMFHVSQHGEYDNIPQKIIYYVFGRGWVGVDVFFLLSTYGLSFSYNKGLLRFYKNRVRRIIPLYVITLVICYIESNTDFVSAIKEFLLQITGLAIFDGTRDILWYMEALVLLYISFPVLYKLTQKVFRYGVFLYILICILTHLLLIFIDDYCLQLAIKRIPVMMLGIITYLSDQDGNERKLLLYYGVLSVVAIMPLVDDMFFYVPSGVILLSKCKVLNRIRFLSFVGRHSLEIFIAHHFSLWGFNYFKGMNYYFIILLILISTIVFSIVAFYVNKYLNLLFDKCWLPKKIFCS